jgi:hypothetical protein
LKVSYPSSGVGCEIALVFIFLCVGLMAIFCGIAFFSDFLSVGVYFVVPHSWCGVSRLLGELLHVEACCRLDRPGTQKEESGGGIVG